MKEINIQYGQLLTWTPTWWSRFKFLLFGKVEIVTFRDEQLIYIGGNKLTMKFGSK